VGNVIRYFRDPIGSMVDLRHRYGDVVCLARGGNPPLIMRPLGVRSSTVFGFGPECNRQILTQPNVFEQDRVRVPKQCPWLADNMSSARRQDRSRQRRTIMPAFTSGHLKTYYPDVVALTEGMLDRWRVGETVELTEEIEGLSAAIASKTFYGQDLEHNPEALAAIAREVGLALFSPAAKIPINLPGTPYHRFRQLTRRAEEAVLAEVGRRRSSDDLRDDVLSMMLKAIEEGNVELTETQLVGNAFTLFLAGHDVPANAISLTLLLLAQHPRVMAELADELAAEVGGGPPAYEQVWKLPVLDGVVRESLRVLSPATLIWRRLSEPAQLGPYEVPTGTEVLVSPYMTHVDPDVYPHPKRFSPERWAGLKPSPFEYLPFSYGARKCLGAAFAEILLRVVVPMIVQRYRLEMLPDAKVDLTVTFTMKPKGGLPMIVREQDREFHRSKSRLRGDLSKLLEMTE
jgi:cytochrome P450